MTISFTRLLPQLSNRVGSIAILTVLACNGTDKVDTESDDLFDAVRGADRIEIASLVHDDGLGGVDAGGRPTFHGAVLSSDFIDTPEEGREELRELLSSADSYMDHPNACGDEDVALRITAGEQQIDVIVGLTCGNIRFNYGGARRTEYMNDVKLLRLAEIAHDLVPEVDPTEVTE